MPPHPQIPRLTDIIEAAERVRGLLEDISLESFEADWQRQWLVERGIEIISEASRHLAPELKARQPQIPWKKVVGIGNILRHDYGKHRGTHHLGAGKGKPARTGKNLPR